MGNCFGGGDGSGINNQSLKHTTDHTSMHQGLLRDRNTDVYEKYVEKEVLGQGSMGHVARVQVREGTEGGSAFNANGNKKMKQTSSSLSERRKNKIDYALKSIQLDRVSPLFLTELKNEISILKEMVRIDLLLLGTKPTWRSPSRLTELLPFLYEGSSKYCKGT